MWTKTAVRLDANEDHAEGWHYAQVWSNGGRPIGYCREHAPHGTEQEARECYSAYLRDHIGWTRYGDWTGCRAEGCDKPTKTGARVDGSSIHDVPLCSEHMNAETAIVVMGLNAPAGDSYGS